jgi:glutamine synthetase
MIIIAEYIWLDNNKELRSKSKVINLNIDMKDKSKEINQMELIQSLMQISLYPQWSYDGSSIGETSIDNSEIILHPIFVCINPFKKAPNVLVLCDTYNTDGNPTKINTRYATNSLFRENSDLKCWFGIEQEFYIMVPTINPTTKSAIPYLECDTNLEVIKTIGQEPHLQYYCSVGSNNSFGRDIVEQALQYALDAGLICCGINSEISPGQWKIQTGPINGVNAADQLIILRYILLRTSELFKVQISFDPNPLKTIWNTSGCHINFSTETMRSDGGIVHINECIDKLKQSHEINSNLFMKSNRSSTPTNESNSDIHTTEFTSGVNDSSVSIRIPNIVHKDGKGYLEDRRPIANADPYLVLKYLLESVV